MEITLTAIQWRNLQAIVNIGKRAENKLGVPVDIDNGDQKIEIGSDEVKITLAD